MREVELKWQIKNVDLFWQGVWHLAVPSALLYRLKKAIPHYRTMNAQEIRVREGAYIIGAVHWFFERNIKYNTPSGIDGRLRMKILHGSKSVRESQDRIFELTLKTPVPDSVFQVQDEKTLVLGSVNGNAIRSWLRSFGWKQRWIYENRRCDIHIADVMVSLRDFPALGLWVEIEGEPDSIRKAARAMGLRMRDGTKKGWHKTWKDFCAERPGIPYDPNRLTFDAVRFAKKKEMS